MLFQFNTDSVIDGQQDVAARVEEIVRGKLDRVADRLSRVEVHVGDVNGSKGGYDIRCAVELRPNGMSPISATDQAASVEGAATSATAKALSAFDKRVGKLTDRKGH